VLRLRAIAGNVFSVDTAAPWGEANNDQCDRVRDQMNAGSPGMLFRFSARAYRIDPARRALAVLQMSPSGGLIADDWQDLGIGFTDLQIASRWNDAATAPNSAERADDPDADGDLLNDWWSSEQQEVLSQPITLGDPTSLYKRRVPAVVRISLVVRTIKKIDAVPTSATPALILAARPNNNDLGDRPAVTLAGVADAARPVELRGDAVFRHATIGADLRNMSVGQ
jgi:hypothetical protein